MFEDLAEIVDVRKSAELRNLGNGQTLHFKKGLGVLYFLHGEISIWCGIEALPEQIAKAS